MHLKTSHALYNRTKQLQKKVNRCNLFASSYIHPWSSRQLECLLVVLSPSKHVWLKCLHIHKAQLNISPRPHGEHWLPLLAMKMGMEWMSHSCTLDLWCVGGDFAFCCLIIVQSVPFPKWNISHQPNKIKYSTIHLHSWLLWQVIIEILLLQYQLLSNYNKDSCLLVLTDFTKGLQGCLASTYDHCLELVSKMWFSWVTCHHPYLKRVPV